MDYDIVVVGAGPGGYHAAIRAAQLGQKTACIEKEYVGGVCLNVGCIPTKALLHASEVLREAQHAKSFGITFSQPEINIPALNKWKEATVTKLTGGVKSLLKSNGVDLIKGQAMLKSTRAISVSGEDTKELAAKKIILATGSEPVNIPGFEVDNKTIINSTGALALNEVPQRFLAIGGGAIGLEFADIYKALGSEVTVVEFMEHLVPASDSDATRELQKALKAKGINIKTKTKALNQKKTNTGVEVTLESNGQQEVITVDKILVAVGRKPCSKNLGLESIGIHVDKHGYIAVNEHLQTNISNIYAIGDVARQPLLAHKAMKEGLVAAEHASGLTSAYDTVVPSVVYTSPELASVGMTEMEAKEVGRKVRTGVFPLAASGRAMTLGAKGGLIKVIADEESDLLLGFHMVGPNAGDIVSEATLAMEMGATLEDIALTQHAHPTIAEGFMEAAEVAHGKAVHLYSPRNKGQ